MISSPVGGICPIITYTNNEYIIILFIKHSKTFTYIIKKNLQTFLNKYFLYNYID